MTKHEESVEKLDVESLIVDLLACGLGGVVILFFIFSIKIIGSTQTKALSVSDGGDKGKNPGFVSMIGDDGNAKRMGSIRIIRFYNLPEETFSYISKSANRPSNFWTLTGFKDAPKLLDSLRMQVLQKSKEIDFILYADGMREVGFKFPEELKRNFPRGNPLQNASVEIIFIEGSSVKGDFKGLFSKTATIPTAELPGISIRLKIGRIAKIDRLIEISTVN